MNKHAVTAFGLAGILWLTVGGCPTTTPVEVTIAGTWSGTLSCTSTQSLNGAPGLPVQGSRDLTITFDASGVPTGLPIWGFVGADTRTVTISQAGQSETVNFTSNNFEITLVVTVTEATYAAGSAHVVLDVQYTATSGNLVQDGDATVTIDATASGEQLTFSATVVYAVTQTAGSVSFETGDTIACTGTLAKQ